MHLQVKRVALVETSNILTTADRNKLHPSPKHRHDKRVTSNNVLSSTNFIGVGKSVNNRRIKKKTSDS